MVERSLRGKFPSLWFIKDSGIFGVLWRKFLFNPFGSWAKAVESVSFQM